jgi:hypothetical protein
VQLRAIALQIAASIQLSHSFLSPFSVSNLFKLSFLSRWLSSIGNLQYTNYHKHVHNNAIFFLLYLALCGGGNCSEKIFITVV